MRYRNRGASLLSMLLGLLVVGLGAAWLARRNINEPMADKREAEYADDLDDGSGESLQTRSAKDLVMVRMCRNDCTGDARACRALSMNADAKSKCNDLRLKCVERCE